MNHFILFSFDSVKKRFREGKIYTAVSDILISINPYKTIPALYDLPSNPSDSVFGRGVRISPHVFSTAHSAHSHLTRSQSSSTSKPKNQAIIISGESGAGKTEACKLIMRYLGHLSSSLTGVETKESSDVGMEEKILACNPILEAFGNAKTLRNDNSSRFGKFLKLLFSAGGSIQGAFIDTYLLEKSRVISQQEGERNYHIFYLASHHHNIQPSDFEYLMREEHEKEADVLELELEEVLGSMAEVGFSEQEVTSIFSILKGILHLGNIQFSEQGEEKKMEMEDDVSDGGNKEEEEDSFCFNDSCSPSPQSCHQLVESCSLLSLEKDSLSFALTHRIVQGGGRASVYVSGLTSSQAEDGRDALAKDIYSRLFSWLVAKVNKMLCDEKQEKEGSLSYIGILDIFGFEIFDINSFEQLCINFANEKLHSLFNSNVFEKEIALYEEEGIDSSFVTFTSNQLCLTLIEGKNGVFPTLNETCSLSRDDDSFISSLYQKQKQSDDTNPHFLPSKRYANELFGISHFAGQVNYHVEGFVEKNGDKLLPDLENAVKSSENVILCEMYTPPPKADGSSSNDGGRVGSRRKSVSMKRRKKSSKKSLDTIASKFVGQLERLMIILSATDTHFVRTIKPNTEKSCEILDSPMIMNQLRFGGVMDIVKIRNMGYPIRMTWGEVIETLDQLEVFENMSMKSDGDESKEDLSKRILEESLPLGHWQEGKRLIFMKQDSFDKINVWKYSSFAVKIQSRQRGNLQRASYQKVRKGLKKLTGLVIGYLLKKKYMEQAKKVVFIQRGVKHWLKRLHLARYMAARNIQCQVRVRLSRNIFNYKKASLFLVRAFRRLIKKQKRAKAMLEASIKIQSIFRMGLAMILVNNMIEDEAATWIQTAFRKSRVEKKFLTIRYGVMVLQKKVRYLRFKKHLGLTKQRFKEEEYARRLSCASSTVGKFIKSRCANFGLEACVRDLFICVYQRLRDDFLHILLHFDSIYPFSSTKDLLVEELLRTRERFGSKPSLLHAAVIGGDEPILHSLIHHCPDLVWEVDGFGRTPLHVCCALGDERSKICDLICSEIVSSSSSLTTSILCIEDWEGNTPIQLLENMREDSPILEVLRTHFTSEEERELLDSVTIVREEISCNLSQIEAIQGGKRRVVKGRRGSHWTNTLMRNPMVKLMMLQQDLDSNDFMNPAKLDD